MGKWAVRAVCREASRQGYEPIRCGAQQEDPAGIEFDFGPQIGDDGVNELLGGELRARIARPLGGPDDLFGLILVPLGGDELGDQPVLTKRVLVYPPDERMEVGAGDPVVGEEFEEEPLSQVFCVLGRVALAACVGVQGIPIGLTEAREGFASFESIRAAGGQDHRPLSGGEGLSRAGVCLRCARRAHVPYILTLVSAGLQVSR